MTFQAYKVNIFLFGTEFCGKKQLINAFINTNSGNSNISQTARKEKQISLYGINLTISFHSRGIYYFENDIADSTCDGYFIVFSLSNRESFEAAKSLLQITKRVLKKSLNFVLIANKSDLHEERVISKEELALLEDRYDIHIFEVSAIQNTNVSEALIDLLSIVLTSKQRIRLNKLEYL